MITRKFTAGLVFVLIGVLSGACAKNEGAKEGVVMSTPETVVQKQVDAYNSRDVEKFMSYYSDDIVIYKDVAGSVAQTGKEEVKKVYRSIFEESPNLNVEIRKRIVQGEFVIDQEQVKNLRGKSFEATAIYRVVNGLITQVWFVK